MKKTLRLSSFYDVFRSRVLTVILAATATVAAQAQQTWDFTQTPEVDVAALSAATSEWSYDEGADRYISKKDINGFIMAGRSELKMTEGLSVSGAAAGKLKIDVNKRLQLGGKNITIATPSLRQGQVVTITFTSTGENAVTFDQLGNLSGTSGFTAADKSTTQTGTGTVTSDGMVTFASSTGSINVFSISVSAAEQGGEQPADIFHDVPQSNMQNQAVLELNDGSTRYYNTANVAAIGFTGVGSLLVRTLDRQQDKYNGNVEKLSFTKKSGQGQSGEIENGGVEIIEAKGWLESLYAKWSLNDAFKSYAVYVKGGQYSDFTKIDDQLVRNYGTYGRADVVGLRAGTYELRVVPVIDDAEDASKASIASNLEVKNYDRQGYAHFNYSAGIGAYNDDGTLKQGAKVFYVTKNTAKTIKTSVAGAETNPCVGLQAIIEAYEKGQDKTPIAFRFIGLVSNSDIDYYGSKEEGIQVKGRRADSELNMTFEGIGDDATIHGFGFLVRNAKSVEFRNFASMRCMDDGLSLDTDNSNIWIHHVDFFYGPKKSGDQIKGDGACDVKADSKYVTVSYNRFWDTGKSNMFGMKSESGPNYISYHHNWFDHSDSRHPRVRTMSVHVWNNYFDNVAKYGVGATNGASVFVENNYFLKTKKPILSSQQGTDAQGTGTFSGEDGGMIKAYGNYFDRLAKNFKYYTQNSPAATGYDAYESATRDEQVPLSEIARVGGSSYNNFDTNSTLIYQYTPDAATDVPSIVTGYYGAGRLNHGDFTYTFSDNVGNDDTDSAYDATLGGLLDSYKSKLVGLFGEEGTPDNPDNPDNPETPVVPEGTILASFDNSPSHSMFTIGGAYGDGKITYDGTYYKKGVKLNSSGSITFTPAKDYKMTIVLATAKNGRDVKVNGTTTTVGGTVNTNGAYYEMEPIAITAGTEYKITKGGDESILMLIKLISEE